MGTAAHEYRKFLAHKLWRDRYMTGWVSPWWKPTKKDEAAFKFWRDRGYIEDDRAMMRLTEAGRIHYGNKTEIEARTECETPTPTNAASDTQQPKA